ncbi:hypothetical protein EYZ11_011010 [Aspergillus tanneri]|nr:hypothetical protein EYZ11_011010 [Aspergillus tanneri]
MPPKPARSGMSSFIPGIDTSTGLLRSPANSTGPEELDEELMGDMDWFFSEIDGLGGSELIDKQPQFSRNLGFAPSATPAEVRRLFNLPDLILNPGSG